MCISPPKIGAGQAATPTQISADNLQLGTTAVQRNQATVLGRLALTAPKAATPANGTPGAGTTTTTPSGTLGLAPGAAADAAAGKPLAGGNPGSPYANAYSGYGPGGNQ